MKQVLTALILLLPVLAMAQKAQYTVMYTADHTYKIYFKFLTDIGPMVSGATDGGAAFRILKTAYGTDPNAMYTVTPNTVIFGSIGKNTLVNEPTYWITRLIYTGATGNNANRTYTAGTEYLLGTVVLDAAIPTSAVDIADYPNNQINSTGPTTNGFYMTVDGNAVDNDAGIFYGNPTTNSPVNSGNINGLSTMAFNTQILPVTLVNFGATKSLGKVDIAWSTATELNSAGFVVERSGNARSFIGIANVSAIGTGANNYAAIDANPLNGTSFYRLKNLDKDGAFTYSNVVKVDFDGNSSTSVYPIPTSSYLNFNVSNSSLFGTTASIMDISGRNLKAVAIAGSTQKLNVSNMPTGIYFIKLVDGSCVKFIKQ